jgi:hypothetical protein
MTDPSTFYRQTRMRDLRLVKRYVYDLNDVVAELQNMFDLSPEERELARAWIIDHLYQMHYLDVDLIQDLPLRCSNVVHRLEVRGGRYTPSLQSSLWHLFKDMALDVCNSEFFNASFRHNVLSVAVYN